MKINKEDSQEYELFYRVRGEILGYDIHPFPLSFRNLNKLIEGDKINLVLQPECIHVYYKGRYIGTAIIKNGKISYFDPAMRIFSDEELMILSKISKQ